MRLKRSQALASAPGKVVLCGEHFVVYDNPAILAAISRRVKVKVRVNNTGHININSDLGLRGSFTDSTFKLINGPRQAKMFLAPLYESARLVLSERRCQTGLDIDMASNLPERVGLGSSAACCVAITAAVDSLFHEPNKSWICAKAIESERLIHKDSSGADCHVSTFGGLMYFVKNEGFKRIDSKIRLPLRVLNTGIKHSTRNLVIFVRNFKETKRGAFKVLAMSSRSICEKAFLAIKEGDQNLLGNLMYQNHLVLQEIGVSNKKMDELVGASLANGALGAKITGAGGGGSIVILMPQNKKRKRTIFESFVNYRPIESIPVKLDYNGLIVY